MTDKEFVRHWKPDAVCRKMQTSYQVDYPDTENRRIALSVVCLTRRTAWNRARAAVEAELATGQPHIANNEFLFAALDSQNYTLVHTFA